MRATEGLLVELVASIGVGRDHPTSGSLLAANLGISERSVRALVEEARRAGMLIGSSPAEPFGYFLAVDEVDVEVGTRHLRSRAMAMLQTVRAVERSAIARFPGTQLLFDLETASEVSP